MLISSKFHAAAERLSIFQDACCKSCALQSKLQVMGRLERTPRTIGPSSRPVFSSRCNRLQRIAQSRGAFFQRPELRRHATTPMPS
jgi:hypothetical protein